MTTKANAPLPPQDLVVAQEGTDFFMVSWLPPYPPYGPHDTYKIRYQLLGAERWNEVEKGIKDPSIQCPTESPRFCYNVTGLEPGNQYRVQVSTKIEGGTYGPWSSVVIANTLQVLPDAPRAIHLIEKTDHSLHIRWVPPVDSKGHITQYRVSIISLDDANHPTITYLFDNLNPETSYNISISAGTKRGFGREIWTRYSTDPFVIPIVLIAPVVTPDGASALDVQWNGVIDAKNKVKGYIIEIRQVNSFNRHAIVTKSLKNTPVWQEIGDVITHDSVKRSYLKKLTGLDPDTLYFVVDHKQRVGQASLEAQGRTGCAAPTAPPSNVNVATPSNVQVRVSWQAPIKGSWLCSNIRYKLEYTNGTNPRRQIDLPRTNHLWIKWMRNVAEKQWNKKLYKKTYFYFSASIEHLFDSPSNTKWIVRIRTENDAGTSDWSKELEITTAEGQLPFRKLLFLNTILLFYVLLHTRKAALGQNGQRLLTPGRSNRVMELILYHISSHFHDRTMSEFVLLHILCKV
uniref:Fibronectin type-III domain-containing protein n=1 Tax=Heterorhabditis bacteriophora TaxID=37862 RepID=A0A1I7XSW2_HETBA